MIDIRPWCPADKPLIMHAFKKVMRAQGPRWMVAPESFGDPTYMPENFFSHILVPKLDEALERVGAMVACSKTDPDLIFGFRIGNDDLTHFVFVKSPYRKMGFARRLFKGVKEEHTYTVSTPTERRLRQRGHIPKTWRLTNTGLWL